MRYYRAMVKLGHMGSRNSHETFLYIYAKNIMEAMRIAKKTPAVKHSKMPLNIIEITKQEFDKGRESDPYTKAMDRMNGV